MGEGGGGRRPVVRGRAPVSQLAAVEGAAAGRASGEAETVRRGSVGDTVSGCHRVPLAAGGHGYAAEVDGGAEITIEAGFTQKRKVFPEQTCTSCTRLEGDKISTLSHSSAQLECDGAVYAQSQKL